MGRLFKGCAIGCLALTALLGAAGLFFYMGVVKPMQQPAPTAPTLGKSVALRPVFLRRQGDPYQAGTAVAVRMQPKSTPVLITALHLFGPMGGLEKDLAPGEIDKEIRQVNLVPFGARQPTGAAAGSLRKTGPALTEDNDDLSLDLAAFKLLPKSRVNALDLGVENPKIGEWLWLVGDVVDHEPQTQRLFPAQVLMATDQSMLVRFKERFRLQAFSGAPLINEKKQVVGLLIGGMEEGGLGRTSSTTGLRKRLTEAGIK